MHPITQSCMHSNRCKWKWILPAVPVQFINIASKCSLTFRINTNYVNIFWMLILYILYLWDLKFENMKSKFYWIHCFFHREIKIKRKKYSNTARNFIKILYINEYSSKTWYIKREGNVISEEKCYMGFIELKWSFIMSSCEEKLIFMVKVKVHMTHLKKKHVWSWNLSDVFVIRTVLREWVPSTKIL